MHLFALLTIASFSTASYAYEERALFIPSRAKELLSHFDNTELLELKSDAVIVKVPDSQIEDWSTYIHQEFGSCGGFIDITEDMIEGKTAADILSDRYSAFKLLPYSTPIPISQNSLVAQLTSSVDTNHLQTFMTELTAFDDRSATTANGTRAADFIAQRASEVGQTLEGFQVRKVVTRGYPSQPSVIASYPGTNPDAPHIVIGAHMDTLSNKKPGADDDASGSIVVMEALRAIAASDSHFERTIDFMWYAAEERGLVGSSTITREYKNNNIAVAAAIQFDMTGWVDPFRLHDLYLTDDYVDQGLNQTLEAIIATYLPGVSVGHARCGYACSDHASWTSTSVPAVYPFESSHDEYNRYIHTSMDTMDRLSMDHIAQFAKIGIAFLGHLAAIQ